MDKKEKIALAKVELKLAIVLTVITLLLSLLLRQSMFYILNVLCWLTFFWKFYQWRKIIKK